MVDIGIVKVRFVNQAVMSPKRQGNGDQPDRVALASRFGLRGSSLPPAVLTIVSPEYRVADAESVRLASTSACSRAATIHLSRG